jgi:hypothetical protein
MAFGRSLNKILLFENGANVLYFLFHFYDQGSSMKKISLALVLLSFLGFSSMAFSHGLPAGNYKASCHRCSWNVRNVLRCTCQTANGFYRRTAIKVGRRCDYIQNENGNLTCTSRARHPYHRRSGKVVLSAGPIYNQGQANHRCPHVCRGYRRWDGQWWTVRGGGNSVCECIR